MLPRPEARVCVDAPPIVASRVALAYVPV
ncbi:hypothetical protein M218_00545 [Burkholderia pseudomallei MSHR338]|nr:hypothetical protein M218_00545 [Burkholderia pseudomallei MSHR338]